MKEKQAQYAKRAGIFAAGDARRQTHNTFVDADPAFSPNSNDEIYVNTEPAWW